MNGGGAPWIKIITRIFEDPKIIAIEERPEAGYGVLIIWFKLLTLAGELNRGGAIYFTETVPFTTELLAAKWRCKPALVQLALSWFQKLGMIGIDDEGTILILNWSKYQNEAGLAQIRERSLKQLQDRSPESIEERRAQKRERDAKRQRRWRQSHKGSGSNGIVTRNGAVTRDGSVTGVTVTLPGDDAQRETVTPENKTKNKNVEEPSTVSQRETSVNDFSSTKEWLNKFFGRQRAWSYEEDQLLAGLLPISRSDRALLSWAYTLPRDPEGWVLIDGKRTSKPKQSLVTLLREFSSETDKWRLVRANLSGALTTSEDHPDVFVTTDEWTPGRRAAFEKLFPGSEPGPFRLLDRALREQIDAKAKEDTAMKERARMQRS